MLNQFSRTEMLIGEEGIKKLSNAKVAIFGIGGVGSYVAEALARCGVGSFILVDNDKVTITNINRQIIATTKTIGQYKVDLMEQRILDINPNAKIETYKTFYMPDCKEKIIDNSVSYVVDAIDTVTAKIFLIEEATRLSIPVISSMGTGNKLDPSKFEITDIYKTSVCPLAKVMRKELRQRNIKKLNVLYSKEEPIKLQKNTEEQTKKRQVPGSIAFSPSVAGLMIASKVVKDLINI
ncbi:MAG: ThiF family adenylyltransferase [Clostridia bacterium]